MKICDLNDFSINNDMSDNVQNNIAIIKQKYGDPFMIVDQDVKLPSTFLHNMGRYEIMRYHMKTHNTYLLPFEIIFADQLTHEQNNNCFIYNLQKTSLLSGSDIMNTLLKFLLLIKVNEVSLNDNTKLIMNDDIEIDYSLFKLFTAKQTYYEKFGFKMIPKTLIASSLFLNGSQMDNEIKNRLSKISNLKCDALKSIYKKFVKILNEINPNEITYYMFDQHTTNIKASTYVLSLNVQESTEKCKDLISTFEELINIFKKNKEKTFIELLIYLFNNDISSYSFLEENVLKYTDVVGVKYSYKEKEKSYWLSYLDDFIMLHLIRIFSIMTLMVKN